MNSELGDLGLSFQFPLKLELRMSQVEPVRIQNDHSSKFMADNPSLAIELAMSWSAIKRLLVYLQKILHWRLLSRGSLY